MEIEKTVVEQLQEALSILAYYPNVEALPAAEVEVLRDLNPFNAPAGRISKGGVVFLGEHRVSDVGYDHATGVDKSGVFSTFSGAKPKNLEFNGKVSFLTIPSDLQPHTVKAVLVSSGGLELHFMHGSKVSFKATEESEPLLQALKYFLLRLPGVEDSLKELAKNKTSRKGSGVGSDDGGIGVVGAAVVIGTWFGTS